jgi:phosphoglycolate phosphatase-like HAD superfamily hydrolase
MSAAPLQSWNETQTRRAILAFVERVVRPGSPDFVPVPERVAVFDNDGTLWCEKPLPVQADFLLGRLRDMVIHDPQLRAREPFRAAVERDYEWLGNAITKHYAGDNSDLSRMSAGLLSAYAGSTIEEFEQSARSFFRSAQHPLLKRPYRRCTYQPMRELLDYLESQQFTNYIVSGGTRDFVRAVSMELYGIPPERVIGSTSTLQFRDHGGITTIVHGSQLGIFDDGPTKPVQIWSVVGRRPLLAAGNANGDVAMMRFCAQLAHPTFSLLLHHDDERREYAYERGADEALRRARTNGWTVVSIKNDWSTIFPSD